MITPVKWADDTAPHIAENVGQQMEDEATASSEEVYPIGQLRRAKARALAVMGRQERYDVSVPVELSEFSYKLPHDSGNGQGKPPGHSEV